MHLTDLIEKTLTAMGYELVEVERAPAGLLRVY
ncbi:ribosome maturation factor RimP, partial [Escherichia coli]